MAEKLNTYILSSFNEFSSKHNQGKLPMFKTNENFTIITDNINKLSKDVKDILDKEDFNKQETLQLRKELNNVYNNELQKLTNIFDEEESLTEAVYTKIYDELEKKQKTNTLFNKKKIKELELSTNNAKKDSNINKYNHSTDNEHQLFKLKIHYDQVEENYISIINDTNNKRKGRIKSNTLEKNAKNLLYTRDRKKETDLLYQEIKTINEDIINLLKVYESNVLLNKKAVAEQTIKFNNLVNTANKQNKESAEKLKKTNIELLLGIERENQKVTQKKDSEIEKLDNLYNNKIKKIDLELTKEDFTNTENIKQDAFNYSEKVKSLKDSFNKSKTKHEKKSIAILEKKYNINFLKKSKLDELNHKNKLREIENLTASADYIKKTQLELLNNTFYAKIDKLKAKKELVNQEFESNIKLLRLNHLQILEKLKWQTSSRKETYNKQLEHLTLHYEFEKKELQRKLVFRKKDLLRVQDEIKMTCKYNKAVNEFENEKIRINHLLFIEKNKHLNTLNHINNIYHGDMSTIKKDMLEEIENINSIYTKNINDGTLEYYKKLYENENYIISLDQVFIEDSYSYEKSLIEYKYDRDKDLLSFDFNNKLLFYEKASVTSHNHISKKLITAINTSFKDTMYIIENTAKVYDNKSFNDFFIDISLYYNDLKKYTIDLLVLNIVDIINNRIIFETENRYFIQEQKALDTFTNNKNIYNNNLINVNTKIINLSTISNSLNKKKESINNTIKNLKNNKKTKIDRTIFSGYIKNQDQLNKDIKDNSKKLDLLIQKKDKLSQNNEILTKSFHNDLDDITHKLKKDKAYYFTSIDKVEQLKNKYRKIYDDKLIILTNYLPNLKKRSLKDIINQYFDTNNELNNILEQLSNKYLLEMQQNISTENIKKTSNIRVLYIKNLERLKNNFSDIKKTYASNIEYRKNNKANIYYSLSKYSKAILDDKKEKIDDMTRKYALKSSNRKIKNKLDVMDLLNDLSALYSNEESSNKYIKDKIHIENALLKAFNDTKETEHHIKYIFREEKILNEKNYKELHNQVNIITENEKIENDKEKQLHILRLKSEANEIIKAIELIKKNTKHEYKKITDNNSKKNEIINKDLQSRIKKSINKKGQI